MHIVSDVEMHFFPSCHTLQLENWIWATTGGGSGGGLRTRVEGGATALTHFTSFVTSRMDVCFVDVVAREPWPRVTYGCRSSEKSGQHRSITHSPQFHLHSSSKPSVNKLSSLHPKMSERRNGRTRTSDRGTFNNISDSPDRNPSESSLGFGSLIHFESLRSPCFYPVVVMLLLLSLAVAASSLLSPRPWETISRKDGTNARWRPYWCSLSRCWFSFCSRLLGWQDPELIVKKKKTTASSPQQKSIFNVLPNHAVVSTQSRRNVLH